MKYRKSIAGGCLIAGLAAALPGWHHFAGRQTAAASIDFNRDIRPILNQSCIACHGGVKQQGGVSFVYREEALGIGKSGRPIVVPGKPNASELMARVASSDPQARMPYDAPALPPLQIELLKRWIAEGAHWEDHWAFVAPKPQPLPAVKQAAWPRQPFDRFILARLENESLVPSPEADKATLLRRLSFDLTGLPPSPQELDTFLTDSSPQAYERQVDRLLASPHYGERWATLWLDLARYADSKGYEQDNSRSVWPYRDWVIAAFNRNLPYDEFVTTQLAGDLLPNATFEDRIATAFHRQTSANDEGGSDDEEFRTAAVMDRVATTWSVLNGITMNCVQCHSHPYDPIRHDEYYESFAFFNTSRDTDAQFDDEPVLHVPQDASQYRRAFEIEQEITALNAAVVNAGRRLAADPDQWRRVPISSAVSNRTLGVKRQLALFERQRPRLFAELHDSSQARRRQLFGLLFGETASQLEQARNDAIAPFEIRNGEAWARAEVISPAAVSELLASSDLPMLTALRVEVLPEDPQAARHTPEQGFSIERIEAWLIDADGREQAIAFGSFAPDSNDQLRSQLALVGVNPRAASARAMSEAPGPPALAEQLRTGGMQVTRLIATRWIVGIPAAPLKLAPGSRIKVQLTQNNDLAIVAASIKPTVARRVRLSASSDPRWTALAVDAGRADKLARIEQLYQELATMPIVPVPVMSEQDSRAQRETLRFERGNFLAKTGVALAPDVPAIFPELPAGVPRNRLTMAQWFFAPGQPLTARVAVNRFWEQLFGLGLVETLEDFGSVGEKPSHPQLLDWLALHFQNDLQWNMKALLRELVLSATYRQRADATPALLQKDPRNRLLAHGPRQRLTAEMVHDQALAASGLLMRTLGGPPAMLPLPQGVAVDFASAAPWVESEGGDRYRRALYTRVIRTSVHPSSLTFDGSGRDISLARRIPTNTPLQALLTLNDTLHAEASIALAQRVLQETSATVSQGEDALKRQMNYAARLVLSRELTLKEMTALRRLHTSAMGDAVHSDRPERAALAAVATVLLNFDAALTR